MAIRTISTSATYCRPLRETRGRPGARTVISLALASATLAHAAGNTELPALSLEQLLQVTVVGANKYEQKQSEVAAAVSVLTRAEIKTFGWRTLGEALASLPGVSTSYDRQYGYLGMRGFGLPGDLNTRTLITINGNRVNDPVFDQGPTGRDLPVNLDLVERIEFIPGPGGAVYGQNAMFGVVNVVTRSGGEVNSTELAGSRESLSRSNEGRATWGRRFDDGTDVLLSLSGLRATGQNLAFSYGATGVSGVAAGEDGERNVDLLAHLARGPWSFDLAAGSRRKDDPTGAYQSDPLVPGQYQQDKRTVAQVQYSESFSDKGLHVLARLFNGSERYTSRLNFNGSLLAGPAYGSWVGAELRLLSTSIDGHKLMFGTELQRNLHQDQYNQDLTHPGNDIRIPGSGYRAGVYAQDEWRVTERLSATTGLRLDRSGIDAWKTSPRVGLIWAASEATTLKGLYGRAHRAPNAFERDYHDDTTQVANPTLQGETIDTFEFVVDQRLGADAAMRISAFRWTMLDLVTLGTDPVSGLTQYQSGGVIQARGLELSADKTWERGTRLRGSIALQDVVDAQGARLPNSSLLLAKIALSTPLPVAGLLLGYELRYDSARRTLDGSELGGYAVSNLTLTTQSLARGLELSTSIYNLLDKRYSQPGARTNWQNAIEQNVRSVRVKLTYSF